MANQDIVYRDPSGKNWNLPFYLDGSQYYQVIEENRPAISTLSNVSASASSVTVLAANAARKKVVIVNDSAATLYLKAGATASLTSFTIKLDPGDTFIDDVRVYTGIWDGIWSSATGAARVTEFT